MTDQYLAPLKVQWRSEHRYLAKEKQRIEARMKELEEMLEAFGWAMPTARATHEPSPEGLGHTVSVAIAEDGE